MGTKKKKQEKKEMDLSVKAKIYLAWQDGEEDVEKLHQKVANEEVKESTVKNWLRRWPKGKGLPAIAKDDT